MPELILGLVVAFMGLTWWFQPSRITSSLVQERPIGRSQIILVNSVEENAPFACRPIEKNEDASVMRNLTEPFEKRRYIVESETQCIPE